MTYKSLITIIVLLFGGTQVSCEDHNARSVPTKINGQMVRAHEPSPSKPLALEPVAVIPVRRDGLDNIGSFLFSPNDEQLICSATGDIDRNGAVLTFDMRTHELLRRVDLDTRFPIPGAISPDAQYFTFAGGASNQHEIYFWDLIKGKRIQTFEGHVNDVRAVAFAPNGKRFVSVANDGNGAVWDTFDREGGNLPDDRGTFTDHKARLKCVAVSPNGKLVATGDDQGLVIVWDIDTLKSVRRWPEPGPNDMEINAITFIDDAKIVVGDGDSWVTIRDVISGKELARSNHGRGSVTSFAVAPDGENIIIGCYDGPSRVWNWKQNAVVYELGGHQRPEGAGTAEGGVLHVTISRNGRVAATAGLADGTIRIWELPLSN